MWKFLVLLLMMSKYLESVSIEFSTLSSNGLTEQKSNADKVNSNKADSEEKPLNRSLRVSTRCYEPFIYQDADGQFSKGLEYELIKTIAQKVDLEVKFQNDSSRSNYDRLIFK